MWFFLFLVVSKILSTCGGVDRVWDGTQSLCDIVYYSATPITYAQAKLNCEGNSGQLVTINGEGTTSIESNNLVSILGSNHAWIGARDHFEFSSTEFTFVSHWADGTPMSESGWTVYPYEFLPSDYEEYYLDGSDSLWKKNEGGSLNYYICQETGEAPSQITVDFSTTQVLIKNGKNQNKYLKIDISLNNVYDPNTFSISACGSWETTKTGNSITFTTYLDTNSILSGACKGHFEKIETHTGWYQYALKDEHIWTVESSSEDFRENYSTYIGVSRSLKVMHSKSYVFSGGGGDGLISAVLIEEIAIIRTDVTQDKEYYQLGGFATFSVTSEEMEIDFSSINNAKAKLVTSLSQEDIDNGFDLSIITFEANVLSLNIPSFGLPNGWGKFNFIYFEIQLLEPSRRSAMIQSFALPIVLQKQENFFNTIILPNQWLLFSLYCFSVFLFLLVGLFFLICKTFKTKQRMEILRNLKMNSSP